MAAPIDLIIVIVTKLVVIFCFIFFLHYWYKKGKGIAPKYLYWTFGLFFTFVIPQTIFDWILKSLFLKGNDPFWNSESSAIASLLAFGFYLFIGLKYFKKKRV
jgi:hypothetical protein